MLPHSGRSAPDAAVGIVASAGGIGALIQLLAHLPRAFEPPIFIAQHLANGRSVLDRVLSSHTGRMVGWATCGAVATRGQVYLVPPGMLLSVAASGFALTSLPERRASWLACGDELMTSLARLYGARTVGIVLSGMMPAGIEGLRAVNRCGGHTMAQKPSTAEALDMPSAAVDFGKADVVLPPWRLGIALGVIADQWARNKSQTVRLH